MTLDNDFVSMGDCMGRHWMSRRQRWFLDLVCLTIGHNLWRVVGSERTVKHSSLPLQATYCRRCFKGGYVRGDYARHAQ